MCVAFASLWEYFPVQCERGGKGPSRGLWSIHPHLRLCNHLIVKSKGIKELFIHSLCSVRPTDYWPSPYVSLSALSAWPGILSVLSVFLFPLCKSIFVKKQHAQTYERKFDSIVILCMHNLEGDSYRCYCLLPVWQAGIQKARKREPELECSDMQRQKKQNNLNYYYY